MRSSNSLWPLLSTGCWYLRQHLLRSVDGEYLHREDIPDDLRKVSSPTGSPCPGMDVVLPVRVRLKLMS